ncbi:MAG TPA: SMC-Scp complex subunit ScpB [Candidatus Binataceae bacterium]|nr:SMC-Scp complex subunit ScpB [Candidatus Binataceae bacterium]
MEEERLKAILEGLLFAAGEPVSLARLGNALEGVARETIKQALAGLAADYAAGNRGLTLEEIAGGYQLRTLREHAAYVRRLLSAKPPRLSRPLLETLAIIAYRRQITRPEIEQLRGVDTGGVLETLLERGLTRIAGHKEVAGRPFIYETTPAFLELFGLKSLDALPDLEELRAIEEALADALDTAGQAPAAADDTLPREPTADGAGLAGDSRNSGTAQEIDQAQPDATDSDSAKS